MKIFVLIALISFNLFAQEEESEALRAMRISCEKHKVGLGCFNYANMLIRAENNELANKFFELGCKQDHSPSCKKEKWVIPDVVITKKAPVEKQTAESNSDSEITSAFDIKDPTPYKNNTTISTSNQNSQMSSSSSAPNNTLPTATAEASQSDTETAAESSEPQSTTTTEAPAATAAPVGDPSLGVAYPNP